VVVRWAFRFEWLDGTVTRVAHPVPGRST
jgi:hypothetical protein